MNLEALKAFAGREVTAASLAEAGLAGPGERVKLLADGDAPQGLVVKGLKVSAAAKAKIEAAGGRIEE